MKNLLFIVGGCQDGGILDSFAFLSYEAAYAKLESIYKANLEDGGDDYDENDTNIHEWGFTIAFKSTGWMEMSIQRLENPGVLVPIPDGRSLYACDKEDPDYPGIKIVLVEKDGTPEDSMGIAWAEYNEGREEYTPEQRLRIMAWSAIQDDPMFNLSFDTGEFETDDSCGWRHDSSSRNMVTADVVIAACCKTFAITMDFDKKSVADVKWLDVIGKHCKKMNISGDITFSVTIEEPTNYGSFYTHEEYAVTIDADGNITLQGYFGTKTRRYSTGGSHGQEN